VRTRLETIICVHNIINLLNFKPIANFMTKAAHILRNDFRVGSKSCSSIYSSNQIMSLGLHLMKSSFCLQPVMHWG